MSDTPTDNYSALKLNVPRATDLSKGASMVPPGMGELNYIQMLLAGLIDQSLYTTSSPTFAGLTLSGLTASALVGTNASKALQSVNPGTSLSLSGTSLNTIQGIRTADSPQFTKLGLGVAPTTTYPLSLGTALGNKIALYDVGTGNAGYGFGIQANLLQIFCDQVGDAVAIGYGYSGVFTQRLNVKGSGLINCIENVSLGVADTNKSHYMRLVCGSDITADRNLSFIIGDAARSITLSGNPTLADWFDQAVKAASSPTFAALKLTTGAGLAKVLTSDADGDATWETPASGMVYPGAGMPISTGAAWDTSVANDTSNARKFLRELSVAGVFATPAWDTLLAADVPTLNQDTTGKAGNLAFGSDAQDDVPVRGATVYGRLNLTEQTLLGRITGGHNAALTASQVKTLLAIAQADVSGLHTGDSPTFLGATFSGLAANLPVVTGSTKFLDTLSYADFLGNLGIGQAWTVYTPTLTPLSGSFTTVSASGKYLTIGKTTLIIVSVILTNVGTATAGYRFSLPNTTNSLVTLVGRESGVTGKMLQAFDQGGGGALYVQDYAGVATIANGYIEQFSGLYENI